MANLPEPQPGLVIRYSYLWKHESDRGQVEGVKDRPCAIVLAKDFGPDRKQVLVVPVTHAEPEDKTYATKLPDSTCRRLGLDGEDHWVIATESNLFSWPGPDVRPTQTGDYSYGFLPPPIFDQIKADLLDCHNQPVVRTE